MRSNQSGSAQKESGFALKRIWQDIDDRTVVFFLCEVWDVTKAKAFVERETVRMKKEGVTEFSDIFHLHECYERTRMDSPGDHGKARPKKEPGASTKVEGTRPMFPPEQREVYQSGSAESKHKIRGLQVDRWPYQSSLFTLPKILPSTASLFDKNSGAANCLISRRHKRSPYA
jgi:hypothetical protein